MMKKSVAIIVAILLILNIFPAVISAADNSDFELCYIEIQNKGTEKNCVINGRFFGKPGTAVNMEATGQSASSAPTVALQTVSSTDGSFIFEFGYDFISYKMCIKSDSGKQTEFILDLRGIEQLLTEKQGYTITSLLYDAEKMSIKGFGTDLANKAVTIQITDEEGIKDVNMSFADGNGKFGFDFNIEPGCYVLCLNSETAKQARFEFNHNISNAILSISEREEDKFIRKLEEQAQELEALAKQCNEKGMTTDYENANIQIIKKFAQYAEDEIENNDPSRLGQYNYTLTNLYEETAERLHSYLNNEKEPLSVPKYVTSDIRFDGKGIIAKAEEGGVIAERPMFFVGYGHFDTMRKETSFFSDIGLNTTQYAGLYMEYILRGMPVPGWGEYVSRSSNATFAVSEETSVSGNKSLKVTHPDETMDNHFKRLSQPIQVKPNTTYEYGLKAKASGVSRVNACWFRFDINGEYGGEDEYYTKSRRNIENSPSWKEYKFEYTTGANETILPFVIAIEAAVGSVYIDDIYVREKGEEENLLFNGGMEDEVDYEALSTIEKEAYDLGLIVDYTHLNKLEDLLARAEENNILVDVGGIAHTLSTYIMQTYPELVTLVEGNVTQFDIHNETAKKILSIYVRLIVGIMSRYDSAKSFSMMNEPAVKANKTTVYDDDWVDYLKKRYGTVDKLNEAWGTSYKSFETITMPNSNNQTACYNEYLRFNESLNTEINSYIAEIARSVDEDILIHTKVMDYFHSGYSAHLDVGANYEELYKIMDVNGCDAFSHYGREGYDLSMKMAWYDFQTSMLDAPVWDTESHILKDGTEMDYSPIIPYYMGADVWNGAIHGRGNQVLWVWDRSHRGMPQANGAWSNSNAALRPAEAAEVARTALDLNRLAYEVTAIQKEEPKIGLLYSITSSGYSADYMEKLKNAYEQIIFSGRKAGFVTDSRPEDMHKYEMLVVPGSVNNVPYGVVSEIKSYIERGGRVLIIEGSVLKYNENNHSHEQGIVNYIYSNAEKTDNLSEKIAEYIPSSVVLKNADTDEILSDGIEWSYAQYNGRYVINILNYNETAKPIKVEVNGEAVDTVKELRSGEISDTLIAEQYKPMLAAVDIVTLDLIDDKGDILEKNIDTIKQGKIRCSSIEDGDIVLALYKDDVLVKASIGSAEIDIPQLDKGEYRLMVSVWDMEKMIPAAQSKNIRKVKTEV